MSVATLERSPRVTVRGTGVVVLLQVFAITLFVFPSDTVIRAIGASGYAAGLVALLAFGWWVGSTVLGRHPADASLDPMRAPIAGLWIVSLASYSVMHRTFHPGTEVLAADRWLLELAAMSGIVFVAAESLRSVDDCRRVVRVVVAGGAFCGAVAALQYWCSIDLTTALRALPGFSINADDPSITSRAALSRVAGTAIHPIELGVVAGVLFPLAVYLVIHDTERRALRRWIPVVLLLVAIPVSVSRAGVVALVVAFGVFLVLLPPVIRLRAIALVPVGAALVFLFVPGVIRTLTDYFVAGNSDRSIAARTNDVPLIEQLVGRAPLLGRGGGTYLPTDGLRIFDDQYFKTAVELGLLGVCVLIAYFMVPVFVAASVRRNSDDEDTRALAGALVGAVIAAAVCSFTFDSLSFPMFTGVQALVIGLLGCLWRLGAPSRQAKGVG